MSAPANCQLVGRWRIVEADLWGREYLDLCGPAMITIGADNHGEITFGVMQAGLDLGYSPSMVFFTWAGIDETDEVTGDGNAELLDDGSIEITFAYHNRDEAILKAKRDTSSKSLLGDAGPFRPRAPAAGSAAGGAIFASSATRRAPACRGSASGSRPPAATMSRAFSPQPRQTSP